MVKLQEPKIRRFLDHVVVIIGGDGQSLREDWRRLRPAFVLTKRIKELLLVALLLLLLLAPLLHRLVVIAVQVIHPTFLGV